jgi:nicotinate-nucleotide pyrophosphorylase (carboxylating)
MEPRHWTPGFKLIERRAFHEGGALSSKLFLTQGVLLTGLQIDLLGGISKAINDLVETLSPTIKVIVEVSTLENVHAALDAGADWMILKNMSLSSLKMAVRTVQNKVPLESVGLYNADELLAITTTGIPYVSTLKTRHSYPGCHFKLSTHIV